MAQDRENKKLRIHGNFRKRTNDEIWTPEIKLEGLYLAKAGFNVGEFVDVAFENDCIVIRKGVHNG